MLPVVKVHQNWSQGERTEGLGNDHGGGGQRRFVTRLGNAGIGSARLIQLKTQQERTTPPQGGCVVRRRAPISNCLLPSCRLLQLNRLICFQGKPCTLVLLGSYLSLVSLSLVPPQQTRSMDNLLLLMLLNFMLKQRKKPSQRPTHPLCLLAKLWCARGRTACRS